MQYSQRPPGCHAAVQVYRGGIRADSPARCVGGSGSTTGGWLCCIRDAFKKMYCCHDKLVLGLLRHLSRARIRACLCSLLLLYRGNLRDVHYEARQGTIAFCCSHTHTRTHTWNRTSAHSRAMAAAMRGGRYVRGAIFVKAAGLRATARASYLQQAGG